MFSEVIECLEQNIRIPNKWTEYKIFELKYEKTKPLGNTKYDQINLALAVFASAFLNQVSIKLY